MPKKTSNTVIVLLNANTRAALVCAIRHQLDHLAKGNRQRFISKHDEMEGQKFLNELMRNLQLGNPINFR